MDMDNYRLLEALVNKLVSETLDDILHNHLDNTEQSVADYIKQSLDWEDKKIIVCTLLKREDV